MLLTPASQKKLANIGKLYNFEKIELSEFEINNMDKLLKTNPNKFQEYAMKDSLITLKHALWMEGFYFNINGLGIPTTLSNIGNKFVKEYWTRIRYPGYQMEVAPEYLILERQLLAITFPPYGRSVDSSIFLLLVVLLTVTIQYIHFNVRPKNYRTSLKVSNRNYLLNEPMKEDKSNPSYSSSAGKSSKPCNTLFCVNGLDASFCL